MFRFQCIKIYQRFKNQFYIKFCLFLFVKLIWPNKIMDQNSQNIKENDSLINSPLPDYGMKQQDHFLSSQIQSRIDQQLQGQDSNEEAMLSNYQKKLEQIKRNFFTERRKIIEFLPNPPQIVINCIPKNDNLKNQLDNNYSRVSQAHQIFVQQRAQVKQLQSAKKLLCFQAELSKELFEFQEKIKELMKEKKSQLANDGQILKSIQHYVKRKLTKKSQQTLTKLKPYIQYATKKLLRQNSDLENLVHKAEEEFQTYDEELKKIQKLKQEKISIKNYILIQNIIQNELNYGKSLDEYIKRQNMVLELTQGRRNDPS